MALYHYRAYTKDGKSKSGYIDASNKQNALDKLTHMDLYLTSLELSESKSGQSSLVKILFQKPVTLKEKIFFTKQLYVLLNSGIPLVQALDLLSEQTEGQLQDIVITLRDNIKSGESLASGLQQFPKVFDNIFVQLVKAGEASGNLEVILNRLTDYLQRSDELRKKVKSALTLPLIQLAIIVVVVIGLLYFVVPTISETFIKQKIDLPWATKLLISMSNFLRDHYIILLASITLIAGGFYAFIKSERGAYIFDKIKLKLPIIGHFSRMNAVVQFSSTLGMLLEAGVNLSESLNIVTNIIDNKILTEELIKARDKIIKQGSISKYLKETGLFPPIAIYLINTGEQSGQLDSMLLTVANMYEENLKELSDRLAALLNPVMLIIMAIAVGFIIMSIIMPILGINEQISDRM